MYLPTLVPLCLALTLATAEWTFHDFTVSDTLTSITHFASFYVENHNLSPVKGATHKPVLQFTAHGLNVSKVTSQVEMNQVDIELSDKSSIHLERLATDANKQIVEYRFVWKNAGPSLDREVCFHYGANAASW